MHNKYELCCQMFLIFYMTTCWRRDKIFVLKLGEFQGESIRKHKWTTFNEPPDLGLD
jgi:hypothetical protein